MLRQREGVRESKIDRERGKERERERERERESARAQKGESCFLSLSFFFAC